MIPDLQAWHLTGRGSRQVRLHLADSNVFRKTFMPRHAAARMLIALELPPHELRIGLVQDIRLLRDRVRLASLKMAAIGSSTAHWHGSPLAVQEQWRTGFL